MGFDQAVNSDATMGPGAVKRAARNACTRNGKCLKTGPAIASFSYGNRILWRAHYLQTNAIVTRGGACDQVLALGRVLEMDSFMTYTTRDRIMAFSALRPPPSKSLTRRMK
jgi:hypothetical protein